MLYLREHRIAQEYTQEALARAADLSWGTISRSERRRTASTPTLDKLAKALGVQVGDLFAPPKRNGRKRRSA